MGFFLFSFITWGQERTVSGKVTSLDDGSTLPGVNVILKGTSTGTVTDVDGNYSLSVPSEGGTLIFSFVGLSTQEVEIGSRSVIDVQMATDIKQLSEVVVTALGIEREKATVTYATQEVSSEQLNITQDANIKSALAGKVAGVQINGQAGSKLGSFGKIRIRGAISLTSDSDPLYVVDGVPTDDPNTVDMDNVASVNVLKGPNATALYGQRAEAGVVVITTKKGSDKLSVEIFNSTTWDKVSYLPKMQDLYGQGYGQDAFATFSYDASIHPEEWEVFDGERYIEWDHNYADESWGPAFDGEDYVPWYAWWPDSPYYGETAKWNAQPDNIKDFYETGVSMKNGIAVSGGNDAFAARLSYTNLNITGITPYTDLEKHFINSNFEFNATDKLKITSNIRYTNQVVNGEFDDGYGNQTTGSFNSWFARNVEMDKLRELKDLTTFDGHSASWNWWGPDYYANYGGGFKKAAFWFNPYTYLERYDQTRTDDNYVVNLTASYSITDNLALSVTGSRNATEYKREYYFPFFLSNSAAPELYNSWSNSFGKYDRSTSENNFSADLRYNNDFGDLDVSAFFGGNIRQNNYDRISTDMPVGAKSGGLIIPDVYTFANAGIKPTTDQYIWEKQVNSMYGNVSLGYRDFLYLDMSYRRDWSSALPPEKNGYGYPSIGASFIFSELTDGVDFLSFGKLRGGWAQVGNDVDALRINPVYGTADQPFGGTNVIMSTPTQAVDPDIKPSTNTSIEAGVDLRFIESRIGLSFTYYDETREDEIIPVSVPRGSGYDTYLTNAGASSRHGIEVVLDGDIFKSRDGFNWNMMVNFAKNTTTVDELPNGLESTVAPGGSGAFGFVSMIHELGNNWGQLRGTAIKRDDQGNPVLQANGLYAVELDQFLGSVLPDFTGGVINTMSYKGITLMASIDFQKGGKFFSLTEQWGGYSGLTEETAAINDKGNNIRDAVSEGGGVHVTGVDESGAPVDMYVEALAYWGQFYGNRLAEPFIHDASYIKLRDVSLSYDLSNLSFIKNSFIKGVTIGVVGRNLWLISVSDDNKHRWDPSELSQTYGENGQLPGTRSYGVNVRLTF